MQYPEFVELLEERAFGMLDSLFSKTLPKHIESSVPIRAYPTIISLECRHDNNWRTIEFPEYKATRKLAPRMCITRPAYGHLQKLITTEPRFMNEFNLLPISCEIAEGDDIIAALYSHIQAKHKVLVAMDRDFLQIENVNMIDLYGNPKLLTESFKLHERGYALTTKQYKLLKILIGDGADNISAVFPGNGIIRCLKKYVSNVEFLKEALAKDSAAAMQFKRNVTLMDFARIPEHVTSQIIATYEKEIAKYDLTNISSTEPVFDYTLL